MRRSRADTATAGGSRRTAAVALCSLVAAAVSTALAAPRAVHAQPPALRVAAAPAANDSVRISLVLQRVTLEQALGALVAESGMSLLYDDAVLRAAAGRGPGALVSCRVDDAPPEALLRCIVREAGLDYYRLSSGTYVVIARPEALPRYASLAGVVVDEGTGEPLPYATVQLDDARSLRVSGEAGQFAFPPLAPGRYRLSVRALGYAPVVTDLELDPDGRVRERIALRRRAVRTAPRIVNGIAPSSSSAAALGALVQDPQAQPLVAAEPVLFLPGAPTLLGLTRRDGVGDLHIQGGEAGEHLWRLDGAPVFDAAAVSGVFGGFAPLAIGELRVQRAGFGASAGSFTAGVLDLTHELPTDGRPVAVAIDPLTASARIASPFALRGRRGAAMLAVRTDVWDVTRPEALETALRSWNAPDPVLMRRLGATNAAAAATSPLIEAARESRQYQLMGGPLDVRVRDLHGAVRLPLSAFTTLRASGYVGDRTLGAQSVAVAHDSLAERRYLSASSAVEGLAATRDAYRTRSIAAQLRLDRLADARRLHGTQLRVSEQRLVHDFAFVADSGSLAAAAVNRDGNRIREVAFAHTVAVSGRGPFTIDAGAEVVRADARLDLRNGVMRALGSDVVAWRGATFADLQWQLGDRTWLDAGTRLTWLPGTGQLLGEPRLALRREGDDDRWGAWAWRLGGGVYRQYTTQFDVATTAPVALMPSVRFWLPVDGRRGVPTAYHLAAEGTVAPGGNWELRGEVYAKWQPTILAFDYGVLLDHGAPTDTALTPDRFVADARGTAAGAGVRVARVFDLSGMPLTRGLPTLRVDASYDLGLVRRTFPSRFDGAAQAAPWTEPHRASVALTLRPRDGITAVWRTRGVWGRPWALRQTYYDLLDASSGLPVTSPGNDRRPAIIETDVGLTVAQRVGGWTVELGASITNLFDRANVLDYALRRHGVVGEATYDRVPRLLPGRQPMLSVRILP